MSLVEEINKKAGKFYQEAQQENHRFLSWEHCYEKFYFARREEDPDIDALSLHLAFCILFSQLGDVSRVIIFIKI